MESIVGTFFINPAGVNKRNIVFLQIHTYQYTFKHCISFDCKVMNALSIGNRPIRIDLRSFFIEMHLVIRDLSLSPSGKRANQHIRRNTTTRWVAADEPG